MKLKLFIAILAICVCTALAVPVSSAYAAKGTDFVVTGDSGYTYGTDGVLTFTASGTYTVSMASGVTTTYTDRIAVAPGVTADITFDNVNISYIYNYLDYSEHLPFRVSSGSTVNLTIKGSNSLFGCHKPSLEVPDGAAVTINGTLADTFNVFTFEYCPAFGDVGDSGTVTINGGTITAQSAYGPGIGSMSGHSGALTINGGNVTAIGEAYGPGIGSLTGSCGDVTINGGTVGTSGIGGGRSEDGNYGTGGTVVITGGTVYARGYGDAYDIGAFKGKEQGTCVITGGSVDASIQAVYSDDTTTKTPAYQTVLTLPDAGNKSVTCAVSGKDAFTCTTLSNKLYLWEPAGSYRVNAYDDSSTYLADITASSSGATSATSYFAITYPDAGTCTPDSSGNAAVSAGGSYTIAGVSVASAVPYSLAVTGSGETDITFKNIKIDMNISDLEERAFSIAPGAAVNLTLSGTNELYSGRGKAGLSVPGGAALTITGGETDSLIAQSNYYAAGIGGDMNVSSGTVNITGGVVTATGGSGGAGIGGGYGASNGTIDIRGGKVTASCGIYLPGLTGGGAGIGGGSMASGGTGSGGVIHISGGVVNATGNSGGAGIGGGKGGFGGEITISGGTVTSSGSGVAGTATIGADIGGGGEGDGGAINISGGTVVTTGPWNMNIKDFQGIGGGNGHEDDCTFVITGGSLNTSMAKQIQTNDSGSRVYLAKVTLEDASGTAAAGASAASLALNPSRSYGVKDMVSDSSGKLYIWIPYGTAVTEIGTADGRYTGSVLSALSGTLTLQTVKSVSPGGTDEPLTGDIVVTFIKSMDPTAGAVSLDGGITLLTKGVWSDGNKTYTVAYSRLSYGTEYTVTLTGFKDAEGGKMADDASQSFTTEAAPTYTVTLDAQGGSVSPQSKSITYGSAYGTLPAPTRDGYTFSGWYTQTNGGTRITETSTVTTTADTALYAKWEANSYTVTFDARGGSVSPENKSVTYGGTYGTLPLPARDGYKFAGWFTQTSGGTQITEATAAAITKNQTLYAHWITLLNITAVSGNSSYGSVSGGGSYTEGTSVTLTATASSGYYFVGWYNGTTLVSTSATYTFTASSGITLTAQFDNVDFPATITATATTYNKITIRWAAVSGAKGYQVYRSTSENGTYSLIKTTSSTSFINKSVKTGTTYYYKVRAYIKSGSKKIYGAYYSPVASTAASLAQVTGAKAIAVNPAAVKLSWSSVPGKTRYEVWRSTSADGTYTLVKTISSKSYKDKKLVPNTTYYYMIRAYRTVGGVKYYGAYSGVVSAAP